ncbi:MAG: ferritin [Bacteroidota bacterium]
MISRKVQDAFNDQIAAEFSSAYLYLSMSAWFAASNLPGCAHWMRKQFQEEMEHGMKLLDHVQERGGQVVLREIPKPPVKFKSAHEIFAQTLEHEREVTRLIHQLYALALKENDYPAQVELQWFIKEQVEEEAHASEIVEQLKMIGDSSPSLLMLDGRLGARSGD